MRASLRSCCAAICSLPNSNGTSLRVNLTMWWALRAKSLMNIRQTPRVPKNARTSDKLRHGPQSLITLTRSVSGRRPSVLACRTRSTLTTSRWRSPACRASPSSSPSQSSQARRKVRLLAEDEPGDDDFRATESSLPGTRTDRDQGALRCASRVTSAIRMLHAI